MSNKRILTVQDISCVGRCSLTVALPIISACGIETSVLPSAVLSTHTGGFTNPKIIDLTEHIQEIAERWEAEQIKFDAVYTGYLGNVKQLKYVSDIMTNQSAEDALRVIDPVMADNGRLYKGFDYDYVQAMGSYCESADIILPNITEAAFITGSKYLSEEHSAAYIEELIYKLAELGTKKIVLKGITDRTDRLGVAIYDSLSDKIQYYYTRKIERNIHGTGDCFASAFLGGLMNGLDVYNASVLAADFVLAGIEKTPLNSDKRFGIRFEEVLHILYERLKH